MKGLFSILAVLLLPVFAIAQMSVSITTTSVLCFGGSTGTATATVTGGVAPYSFNWAPNGATTATITNIPAGGYTVTVTDATTATATASCVVTQPPQLVVGTLTPSPASYCEGQQVALTSGPLGGTSPYSFLASPGPSWGNNVEAHNGSYSLLVTDANGCTASNTVTLTPYPNPIVLNPTVTAGSCSQTSSIVLSPTGGSSPYTYLWNPGNFTTSSITNLTPGSYHAVVTDATGCPADSIFYLADSCNYVYPGDANEDGVANNIDILDIGIANGATGYFRTSPTITWTPQYCTAWGMTLVSGADYRYVDCDGNGTIQPLDTNAVVLNFGYTHNVRLGAPVYDVSVPDLSVALNQDTLGAGWRGTLDVSLGNSSMPASGVYGVAFTLSFDASLVDAATFSMNQSGSWMGIPGNNLMGVVLHEGTGTGSVQVAITRLNHNDTAGYGSIATVGFNTTNALIGTGNSQMVAFTVSNVTVISSNETAQSVNPIGDSVLVADDAIITAISSGENNQLTVYPNPVQSNVNVLLDNSFAGKSANIILRDVSGREIASLSTNGSTTVSLNTENCADGIYFLSIQSEDHETITKQIVIAVK